MAKKIKEASYILKALVALPGYERKELKIGMSVTLNEEVGDKFAKRGFLVKASAAKSKVDKGSAALEEQVKDLTEANAVLEEANKSLTEQLEEATKPDDK